MEIVDYTEKSLVIKGEKTREYKENLKELGGKFNASLKCGAGWIFPKTKKVDLEALVAKVEKGEVNPIIGKVYTPSKPEEKKTGYQTKYEKPVQKVSNEDAYQFIVKLEAQLDAMKLEINKWKQSLKKDDIKKEEVEEVEYEEEIVEVEEEEDEKTKHPRRLIK